MFNNVVALYGVPRSGTSWLGQIIESCPDVEFRFQPLFSYRFKNRINVESSKDEIETFFEELYGEVDDDFLNQSDKRKSGVYPTFSEKKNHPSVLAYKEGRYLYTIPTLLARYNKIKIIGIVRNPYDVIESWINASSEFKPEWSVEQEWLMAPKKNEFRPENYFGYYKWKECLLLNMHMQQQFPEKFMTVRYEDLEQNPIEVTKKIYDFTGMPYTMQTEKFILDSQKSTTDSIYGVYRNKKDDRRRNIFLSSEIRKKISEDLENFSCAKFFKYK